MKTQSRAFRTSDWAECSPSNRTMDLNTQQEWLIDNPWVVQPQPELELESNIYWETWKCASAHIQPGRAWEVNRWGEEWQIFAKCWWANLVTSYPKRLEAVKVFHPSTELRVRMFISVFLFFINLRSCDISVFYLLLWCMESRFDVGEKVIQSGCLT